MSELPLFPLEGVLFPRWPMPLTIFEARYLEMTRYCVEQDAPFGIVLIKKGRAEFDLDVQPCLVGCQVKVTQMEKLGNGRLLIIAMGQSRFRIQAVHRRKPYLVGDVVDFPFVQEEKRVVQTAVNNLHPFVAEYLALLAEANNNTQLESTQLPHDAQELAFMAAALLQASLETKQSLLEAKHLSILLTYLTTACQQEIDLLKRLPKQEIGNFSIN